MRQRSDGVWYFEVNNLEAIAENVNPFFHRFGFLSAKKKARFRKVREADAYAAARRASERRRDPRDPGNPPCHERRRQASIHGRRDLEQDRKSSETVRQTVPECRERMRQSDLHGNAQSAAEMAAPDRATAQSSNKLRHRCSYKIWLYAGKSG